MVPEFGSIVVRSIGKDSGEFDGPAKVPTPTSPHRRESRRAHPVHRWQRGRCGVHALVDHLHGLVAEQRGQALEQGVGGVDAPGVGAAQAAFAAGAAVVQA